MNVKLDENVVPHKLILNDDYSINKNAIELFNQHFEGPMKNSKITRHKLQRITIIFFVDNIILSIYIY